MFEQSSSCVNSPTRFDNIVIRLFNRSAESRGQKETQEITKLAGKSRGKKKVLRLENGRGTRREKTLVHIYDSFDQGLDTSASFLRWQTDLCRLIRSKKYTRNCPICLLEISRAFTSNRNIRFRKKPKHRKTQKKIYFYLFLDLFDSRADTSTLHN